MDPPSQRALEDAKHVRYVLAGELAGYRLLYDRYARLIRVICHDQTGSLNEAQDLCQEVFLRAYRGLRGLREPEKFGGWVVGIAHAVCREWRRSRARDRHEFVETVAGQIFGEGLVEAAAEDEEEVQRLLEEIRRLPELERTALHLFYLQEEPVDDAREVLGLSRSGFYRVLERARERLKRRLTCRREVTQ